LQVDIMINNHSGALAYKAIHNLYQQNKSDLIQMSNNTNYNLKSATILQPKLWHIQNSTPFTPYVFIHC